MSPDESLRVTHRASPFRAAALDRYARTGSIAVTGRRPAGVLLIWLWGLVLLALGAGGLWLCFAWAYLSG